jgi:hypothetical protein
MHLTLDIPEDDNSMDVAEFPLLPNDDWVGDVPMPQYSTQPGDGPWPLSQVCQRWRDIALAYPRLWTFVRFFLDETDNRPSLELDQLKLYLERSRMLPLQVELRVWYHGEKQWKLEDSDFLRTLFSTSARWHTLWFWTDRERDILLKPLHGKLTNLRYLKVEYESLNMYKDFSLRNVLGKIPTLQHLDVQKIGLNVVDTSEEVSASWTSLQHLALGFCDNVTSAIQPCCETLTSLTLSGDMIFTTPLTLLNVTSLGLSSSALDFEPNLEELRRCSFPSLHTLVLHDSTGGRALEPFIRIVIPSFQGRIEHLTLGVRFFHRIRADREARWINLLLESLPTIESLTIKNIGHGSACNFVEKHMPLLCHILRYDERKHFPRLKHIWFDLTADRSSSYELKVKYPAGVVAPTELLEMIASRGYCHSIAPTMSQLQDARLELCTGPQAVVPLESFGMESDFVLSLDEGSWQSLQRMRDSGLTFKNDLGIILDSE